MSEHYLQFLLEVEEMLAGGQQFRRGFAPVLRATMSAFNGEAIRLTLRSAARPDDIPEKRDFGRNTLLLPDDSPVVRAAGKRQVATLIDSNTALPPPLQGVLLAPVIGGKAQHGLLQIVTSQEHHWGSQDQLAAQVIGRQIGVALENSLLFDQMARQSSELEWLNKVGDSMLSLLSTLQIDAVAERIMNAVRDLLDVEETSIMLKDAMSNQLVLWRHTPAERDLSITLEPGQGIGGWVLANSKTALVNDVMTDPRWEPSIDESVGFKTRSLLAVPVLINHKTVGVVEAVNKNNGGFTEEDEGLLRMLAKWAAIAVGNANTYDELRRATDRLAEAKKQSAMAQMVLNLAHRINNSVGAIRVWALEAREQFPESQPFVSNILQNAEETLFMIRRIRSATDLQTDSIGPVNVTQAIENALGVLRLTNSSIIERHYAVELPPVAANEERLVEVFLNLISNAEEALGADGRITLTTRLGGQDQVEVLVQDTGEGIPDRIRSMVFEPFVTSKSHGLGLGLWMVKLYLEMIGGQITLNTSAEEGTLFCLIMPEWRPDGI